MLSCDGENCDIRFKGDAQYNAYFSENLWRNIPGAIDTTNRNNNQVICSKL